MSAHQNRRQQAAAENRKAMRGYYIAGIVLVLFIAVVILLNSSLMLTSFSAVQVGDTSYNAAEFNYYYYNTYYSYYNYASYMGLDTTQPLSTQQYSEDMTWQDYFQQTALDTLVTTTARYDAAVEAGYTLTEEDQQTIEDTVASMEEAAATNDMSVEDFMTARYGKGFTMDLFREMVEREVLASGYATQIRDSYTYTQEQLEEEYNTNLASQNDRITYSYYLVEAEKAEDEEEYSEEALADAKAKAETIAEAAGEAEDLTDLTVDGEEISFTETTAFASALDSSYSEWLLGSSRKAGDITTAETDSGCYVVVFDSRDDNSGDTVNVRHILIEAEADEEGNYTDEAKAAAKERAEEILQEWKDGDATEESFAALAEEYSADTGSNTNGGLYENVFEGQMVEEFNDFCFDPAREPGDTGIVFNEGTYCGYHIIYFVSWGEPYRDVLADDSLRSADFSAWDAEISEGYEATIGFGMRYAM